MSDPVARTLEAACADADRLAEALRRAKRALELSRCDQADEDEWYSHWDAVHEALRLHDAAKEAERE